MLVLCSASTTQGIHASERPLGPRRAAQAHAQEPVKRYTLRMVNCPNCRAAIDYGDEIETGQSIFCSRCGASWEVTSVNPVALEGLPTVDYDKEIRKEEKKLAAEDRRLNKEVLAKEELEKLLEELESEFGDKK